MPHSSGGGSHSGGSHSGSGFSSSSSSSGGSSAKHIKHTSFPGARRYVYYENYRPVYVYADYDIRKGTASGKFFSILGSAVSLLFGIMLLAMCYDKPQKMDTSPSYHCEIKDTAGVIDDMDKVQNAIVDFYDETGIPVEIMTVNNEDWQGSYSKLEDFAYDMYVTEFDDEEHWLVVYSEPASPDPDFNDWYWEGMQGDDTDNIITVDVADDFKDLMQKYLTANSLFHLVRGKVYLRLYFLCGHFCHVRVALRVVFNVTAHVVSTLHDLCTLVCDVVSDNEKRSHNAVFFKLVKHKGSCVSVRAVVKSEGYHFSVVRLVTKLSALIL